MHPIRDIQDTPAQRPELGAPERFDLRRGQRLAAHRLDLLRREVGGIARDLAALSVKHFDFGGYMLDRVEMHQCNYNWKSFIEVYLEDYHVAPFHPGLGQFVTCDDLKWEFADWANLQFVGLDNFRDLFNDEHYLASFKVTAVFSVLVAGLGLSVSLVLADLGVEAAA